MDNAGTLDCDREENIINSDQKLRLDNDAHVTPTKQSVSQAVEIQNSHTYDTSGVELQADQATFPQSCAGKHFILDFWGAQNIQDAEFIEQSLKDAANVAGAVLLHTHIHRFTNGGGITGVALLAESHISLHSWPEWEYVAFDIFMCGQSSPEKAVDLLKERFLPKKTVIKTLFRGKRDPT